jgi:S-adenosylmethionine synthetase
LAGEVKSNTYLDVQQIARDVIKKIGYTNQNICLKPILVEFFRASADINQGVDRSSPEEQGAGDQGMMFGYATNETENYMPLALDLSQIIARISYLRRRTTKSLIYALMLNHKLL